MNNNKDFADWRNIQLGASPANFFDPIWMPATGAAAAAPPTTTTSPIQPWTPVPPPVWTNPFMNFNPFPPLVADPLNNVIDLTTNSPPTNDFVLAPEIDLDDVLAQVEAVIPDIDLEAARRTLTTMTPLPSSNDIVTHFLDNGYAKKAKRSSTSSEANRSVSLKRSLSDILDDIPKFLVSYPDPVSYFFDTKRKQSESYTNHAKAFLLRAFPNIEQSLLEQALREENCHFLPTVRKLENQMGLRTNSFLQRSTIRKSLDLLDLSNAGGITRMPSTSWLMKNNKFPYAIPHTPCEEFYDELRFAKNEVKIRRRRNESSATDDG